MNTTTPAADLAALATQLIDNAPGEPRLVARSPFPEDHNLAVAVRGSDVFAVHRALTGGGYLRGNHRYVRFTDHTAHVIDLTVMDSWKLSGPALAALFDQAQPVTGTTRLFTPAPMHRSLLATTWAPDLAVGRSRSRLHRLYPGRRIVALSGVSADDRAMHAHALADAVKRLGDRAVVVSSTPRFADPLPSATSTGARSRSVYEVSTAFWMATTILLQRWHTFLASSLRGNIVIFQDYTMDTHVLLLERYAHRPTLARCVTWMNRALSPRPSTSFWLYRPKANDPSQHLYAQAHQRIRAIRLDASTSSTTVAAHIARITWRTGAL